MQNVIHEVPGSDALFKWFGYWPNFHDAEVLEIGMNRSGSSRVRVHTFEMSDQVGTDGSYVCVKHVIVSFLLDGLKTVQLQGFNHQNVLSELELAQIEEEFQLVLRPCFGVEGSLTAEHVRIEIEPGIPLDSQYRKNGT